MKKILIAEDEKPLAEALALKLGHAGYETVRAEDGEKAVELILAGGIDLIILDLIMPKVDGFGVLEEMKEKGISIPVIVASNLSQKEDEAKAKTLGATDYFIKSDVPISELVEKVKAIIGL
jgi:DNA-binding response OmpR family regulator